MVIYAVSRFELMDFDYTDQYYGWFSTREKAEKAIKIMVDKEEREWPDQYKAINPFRVFEIQLDICEWMSEKIQID